MREITENILHILIHELKDPLTIIRGYSELLKDNNNSPEEIAQFSNIISDQADYASYLLNNISTFNKLQDNIPIFLCPTEINLKEVTDPIINIYECKNSKVKWTNKIDEEITVFTDPSILKIILFNLIRNASKYTKEGLVTIDAKVLKDEILWIIEDTGIGIDNDKLIHITELYYRANKEFPGSGIGLYLVSQISQKANIELTIESEINKGTKITLRFKKNNLKDNKK
ncbi:MAG: HAMP domain-containing histidine kinase [Abditibacteriota bacterium]|nr:HAMP domain-containing histidine kinase [Abditibacteriota bacterium]